MISVRTIDNARDLSRAEAVYLASFPPEERRDWRAIASGTGPRLLGIYDGAALIGLVTTWEFEAFVYIEHLAVDAARRQCGAGSAVLRELAGWGKPLLVEVEPPDMSDDARRRVQFYRRNGFATIAEDYVQPPYGPGLPSVPLHLMSNGPADAALAAETLHAEVYGMRP